MTKHECGMAKKTKCKECMKNGWGDGFYCWECHDQVFHGLTPSRYLPDPGPLPAYLTIYDGLFGKAK